MNKKTILGLIFTFAITFGSLSAEIERRAAFDLGSGSIKIAVADVDTDSNSIVQYIWEHKVEVPMNAYLKENGGIELPEEAYSHALSKIFELKTKATSLGATDYTGVATAVYREALNGDDVIQQLTYDTDIEIKIISQADEGYLGFATAAEVSNTPKEHLICWDVGGGSFQISALVDGEIKVYKAAIGGVTAKQILMEHAQGRIFSRLSSPNPVDHWEMSLYVGLLTAKLADAPAWLTEKLMQEDVRIVGIGGDKSMFSIATQLIGRGSIDVTDVLDYLYAFVGFTDAELDKEFKEPGMVVANIGLMYSTMSKLGINEVSYAPVTGSTTGILTIPRLWIHDASSENNDTLAVQPDRDNESGYNFNGLMRTVENLWKKLHLGKHPRAHNMS